uniref:Uncharacterized protein n=1 Tax=Candidozyma auris TaxID=498019 RepID=A0A0L0NV95_CANAR
MEIRERNEEEKTKDLASIEILNLLREFNALNI